MFPAIALGGGGVRGFLLVGALQRLAQVQKLEFPQGIQGVSIGSILATALAYRIHPNDIQKLFQEVSLDDITPSIRLTQLWDIPKTKGLQSMDSFEVVLRRAFQQQGIDLTEARISDAPQPLHIVASNLTRSTPTIFQGNVRILDALKASCALPFQFQPQIIQDSVQVDGGLQTPSIVEILPTHLQSKALIMNMSRPKHGVQPEQLSEMTPWNFVERLWHGSVEYRLKTTWQPNVVWLRNDTVSTMDKLSSGQQETLVSSGVSQFASFLSQRLDQPATESRRSYTVVIDNDLV